MNLFNENEYEDGSSEEDYDETEHNDFNGNLVQKKKYNGNDYFTNKIERMDKYWDSFLDSLYSLISDFQYDKKSDYDSDVAAICLIGITFKLRINITKNGPLNLIKQSFKFMKHNTLQLTFYSSKCDVILKLIERCDHRLLDYLKKRIGPLHNDDPIFINFMVNYFNFKLNETFILI